MVVLESQDFLDRVDAMIRSAVARAMATTPTTAAIQQAVEDELLTIKQAAEMLDVSVATVHEYKRRGMLSYQKIAGRSYIRRSVVLAAGTQHQRTAKTSRVKGKPPAQ